ncbi:MAG: hypothetical protein C4525_03205 [Desulfarculus sp.]|jgi:hypothetical protein|nr:MAG: hypothetical protein C4525_03205 [Desulfarculus sp.]
MAYIHKWLADPSYAPSTAAALIDNGANKRSMPRCIIMHNTHTAALEIELYAVPASGGALGAASAANRFLKKSIPAGDTLIFEAPGQGLVLDAEHDSIQYYCATPSKIVTMAFGGEEDT